MSVDPGEGYRLLEQGETLQAGDQFYTAYGAWLNVHSWRYGSLLSLQCRHRRKIEPATGTEASVCADIAARQRAGVAKYGTTVANNPLSLKQWLQHAYEECLDQAVYLRRAIDEIGV